MRMTADQLQQRLHAACVPARRWTRGKTLAEAWRTCHVGGWMAWWLWCYTNAVSLQKLEALAVEEFGESRKCFTRFASRKDNLRWANRLRKTFRADGTRRTV